MAWLIGLVLYALAGALVVGCLAVMQAVLPATIPQPKTAEEYEQEQW